MIETYVKNDGNQRGRRGDRLNQRKLFRKSTRKALKNVLFNPKR